MEYRELAPPPPLDELVHCFWFLRGEGEGPPQTVVPDGRIEIVVHLAEPFAEVDASGAQRGQAPVLVGGQLTGPIRLAPRGPADIVGIRFHTDGAHRVLPFPPGEIADGVAPLADLAPSLAASLAGVASREHDVHARAAAVSRVLGRAVHGDAAPGLAHAVHSLGSRRPPRSDALARELGMSVRTLERRLRAEIGLSPRDLRRVLRFRRAFALLDGTPRGAWSRVAVTAGYFDQAHLIREFRELAGSAPSVFFRSDPELSRAFLGPESQRDA
jgi:AraC-like DNA-binding protein